MRKQKGFTLIELLVVIAIIGLLSTLAVVALNNARLKSRDARRVADIKQIQTALELYYNDANGYPAAVTTDGTGSISFSGTTYMAVVPKNPLPGGMNYAYTPDGTAPYTTYHLDYLLEGTTGGIPGSVTQHATPAGIK